MKQDRQHHRDQRFDSYSGNLIHDGPRQNSRERERRLLRWLTKVLGRPVRKP